MNLKKIIIVSLVLLCVTSPLTFGITDASPKNSGINFYQIYPNYKNILNNINIPNNKGREDQTNKMTLNFTGDVSFGVPYGYTNPADHYLAKDTGYFFKKMKSLFKSDDFTVINLENVLTGSKDPQQGKIFALKSNKNYVEALGNSSIEIAGVMNNHAHDYKDKGLNDTIQALKKAGIKPVGYNNIVDDNPELGGVKYDQKQILEKNGIKVGLVNYLAFSQYYPSNKKIKADFSQLKEDGAEYIIVLSHGGGQNTKKLTWYQPIRAKNFIDHGADLVINNHPHTLQKMETYKGKRIYHSLGNFLFVFNSGGQDHLTAIVNLTLEKNSDGAIMETFKHIPVSWTGPTINNNYQPTIQHDKKSINYIRKNLNIHKNEIIIPTKNASKK